ncbi:hypothetical protein GQ600_5867 [Phytophthora cactorum]|nr:hypothetical protein GQ600_10718 [Phytophthora cactorum]KAF1788462.1 hypothetical protein GQ600_5867 [Phytophthora cactorum]
MSWRVSVNVDLETIPEPPSLPEEIAVFWGKFLWAENPWIPDVTAQCLPRRKLIRIQVTSIQQLNIMKTERAV